jgi:1-deoxy-D-xylulose-5-phosphate synthase
MGTLETLHTPADLRGLGPAELEDLAAEIRAFLVDAVCRTGGHLGPNLGVVELTIGLHRVFDSPHTPIVFDTGHQAYVHKLLTGRREDFALLRKAGGLSGYPNHEESRHDVVENSHASTALAYADGLSKGFALRGEDRSVVAVVGDGALTGGLSWEALNNLGASPRPVVVVLNDNGRSYAPTVGGLPRHLARLADRAGYGEVVDVLGGTPVGSPDSVDPQSLFGALGLAYVGPVDGHDIAAVEEALRHAASLGRPVVVHCLTHKGAGYLPAENDDADRLHSVGSIDPVTGRPAEPPRRTWTHAFSEALLEVGAEHPEVVAVSAAMVEPTGLGPFASKFPERCFDTGIAEQHAVTSAAGLAMTGAHPVVAVYATFANRAFDQTLLDVGLHRLPVTFVLDRAGVTGPDGPSHHGVWDFCLYGMVPGMRVAAPRDATTLAEELAEAVAHGDGPTALRFPKASAAEELPALSRWHGVDLLRRAPNADVLLVPVGALAAAAVQAADALHAAGIECTVADPRWVLPVNPALADVAAGHRLVVTIEDGLREGGVGSRTAQLLDDLGVGVRTLVLGLPPQFLAQGDRSAILAEHGLDAAGIAAAVRSALLRMQGQELPTPPPEPARHLRLSLGRSTG